MNRVYAYIRYSTDGQKDGNSLERQIANAKDYAAKNGLGPVDTETFRDLGVSAYRGTNAKRGGSLHTFLERVKAGEIGEGDWLIVENLDRLSRGKLNEAYDLLRSITSAGVRVATTHDGKVYENDYDFITFVTFAAKAQLANDESAKKSSRLCAAWAAKRKGIGERKLTGKCPGWLALSADKKTFTVIPERAATVRRIFAVTAEGRGRTHIANTLNEEKVPTWKTGEGWSGATIGGILSSRAVFGEFTPCNMVGGKRVPVGEVMRDYYPPVISEADFYAAQAVVKGRKNTGGRAITSANNLFSRLCFCAECEGPVHYVDKTRGARYLRCDRTVRKLSKCEASSVRYDFVENLFIKWIVDFDFTGSTKSARAQIESKLAAAKELAKEANRKMERLTEAMSTSGLPVSTFLPQIGRAKTDADAQNEESAKLTAELGNLRAEAPNLDAAKLAKIPEHRFRLREEIRRRVEKVSLVFGVSTGVVVKLRNGDVVFLNTPRTKNGAVKFPKGNGPVVRMTA